MTPTIPFAVTLTGNELADVWLVIDHVPYGSASVTSVVPELPVAVRVNP